MLTLCGASEPWSLIIAKFLGPGMVKQKLVAQLGLIIQEKTPSGSSAVATFPFLVPTLRRPGAARGLSRVFRGSPDPRDAVLLRGGVSPAPKDRGMQPDPMELCSDSPLLPVRPCSCSFGNHSVCRVPRVAGAAGGSEGSCAAVG